MAVKKLLIGITGATGMLFIRALLDQLSRFDDLRIHGIISEAGEEVLRVEEQLTPQDLPGVERWFAIDDFSAPPASGSSGYDGMVILPCSMGTLAGISHGLSINLIHRSGDVLLKERKKLILGVRETPLNKNHLTNMLRAHEAGAVICPPMPSYYLKPKTLYEAATYYSWRVLDQLGLEVTDRLRWGGE